MISNHKNAKHKQYHAHLSFFFSTLQCTFIYLFFFSLLKLYPHPHPIPFHVSHNLPSEKQQQKREEKQKTTLSYAMK